MSPKDIAPARPHALRSVAHRRAALAMLAAASALTVSACGAAPTGTINTRAGYSVTSEDVPVSVCPTEGESRFTGDEGLLVGAHFALRVECVASFDEIPEGFQLDYLFGESANLYPPEPGYEFTLVQFAPDPGVTAPYTPESPEELSATLAIGDRTWNFDGEVPAPGAVYFAVAKKDSPITLDVADVERTQAMDLRERTREGLVQALYTGKLEVDTEPVSGSVDGYTTEGSYEYWFDDWKYSTKFIATREVFRPGEGWVAEPDRAVLGLEFGWLLSGSGLEWGIDLEDALKVTGPDGALTPLTTDHVDEDLGDGVWRTFTLTYDVPADALAFTLDFHPKGPVKWPEEDISMPITGDQNHEIPVSFE